MSDTNILREYLVKLGFKVDESQMKKWDQNIKGLEKGLNNLAKNMAAVGVVVGVAMDRVGRKLDEVYFASKRIGASAGNIRAFGYAVSQLGGDAADAQNSMEAVARLLRNAPGSEGLLASIGVQARDANGGLRDMGEIFKDLSKAFQGMEYYKANAFAEALGIDGHTLQAMRSGEVTKYMEEHQRLMKQMGFDADAAAKAGREYAQAMREMAAAAEVLGMKMQKYVLPVVREATEAMREFSKFMDKPEKLIEQTKVVKDKGPLTNGPGFLDKLLPRALVDWLNPGVKWPEQVKSGQIVDERGRPVAGAGKGASPAALFANLEATFGLPAGILDRMWKQESGRGKNMLSPAGAQGHFQFMPGTAKQYGLKDPNDLNASATAAARYLKDLLAMFGGDINKAVAAYNWGPGNVQKYGLGSMPGETRGYVKNVAGSGVQVTQQTSIVVQGSADPYATGQAVANQQNRVAQDAIRNFAPLVR